MIVIGALAQLVHMPQQYLEEFVEARFRRGRDNDDEIISSNIQAMNLGRQHAAEAVLCWVNCRRRTLRISSS